MKNRRQRASLRSAFKLRLTRYMLFLVIFALVTLGAAVLFFFLWSPIPRHLLFITDPHAQSTARVFSNTVRILFVFFFVLNLLFLWLISVIAKSILGPFVRINRVLEQLVEGRLPKEVRFRKNDEAPFQQLVGPFNRVLGQLRGTADQLRDIRDEVNTALARAEAGGLPEDAREPLVKVKAGLDRLVQNGWTGEGES